MLNECYHPGEIGRFVLLDVDVSGVPRNIEGIVRSSTQEDFFRGSIIDHLDERHVISPFSEDSPPEDATLHIEADWDGDPDRLLMCVRYRGRQISSISPTVADVRFCDSF